MPTVDKGIALTGQMSQLFIYFLMACICFLAVYLFSYGMHMFSCSLFIFLWHAYVFLQFIYFLMACICFLAIVSSGSICALPIRDDWWASRWLIPTCRKECTTGAVRKHFAIRDRQNYEIKGFIILLYEKGLSLYY